MSEGEAVIGKTSLEQLPTWKTAPTRPYRVSICRINEKVANGVRRDRLGKVRPDRFASRREHIVVEASFFFFESCSKIGRSEEGLRCFGEDREIRYRSTLYYFDS